MQTVGIVGFGRFAQFWAAHLARDFAVVVSGGRPKAEDAARRLGLPCRPLPDVCRSSDAIFLCVPINRIEEVVQTIAPYMHPGLTVLDVCSVKEHPARVMQQHLSSPGVELIATHPMFGPDSGRDGLDGLRLVMSPITPPGTAYAYWQAYFSSLRLRVVEMSPTEHDRLAAYSQGIAHYVGRVLERLSLHATPIDTRSFEMLLSVIDHTANDTVELFRDLQTFNRFTVEMRRALDASVQAINSQLVTARRREGPVRIGLQNGRGTLDDDACREFCARHDVREYEVTPLTHAEAILEQVHDGRLDRGVFVLNDAQSGLARDALDALTSHPCQVLDTLDAGESTFVWVARRDQGNLKKN